MGAIGNYAREIELGVMMYIPSSINIGSGIRNVIGVLDIHTQTHANTHTQEGNVIIILLFFKIWNVA